MKHDDKRLFKFTEVVSGPPTSTQCKEELIQTKLSLQKQNVHYYISNIYNQGGGFSWL